MSNLAKFILVAIGIGLGVGIAYVQFPHQSKKTLSTMQKEAALLEKQAQALEKVLFKEYLGIDTSQPSPSPVISQVAEAPSTPAPASSSEYTSKAAIAAKQNAEIFLEMFEVVYIRNPKDRGEFGNWVDTLNQGASLEGVYNGLIYGAQYKDLETNEPVASAAALRAFGEELVLLEAELPQPTKFVRYPGEAFPVAETPPNYGASASPTPLEDPKDKLDIHLSAEQYAKYFVGCSVFTLKRALGEEALKVFTAKGEFKEKMALWYSKWVVHMTQRNINFGVLLRNKPDEPLHYKWAVENSEDRVKWEALNRLHRVLNEVNSRSR